MRIVQSMRRTLWRPFQTSAEPHFEDTDFAYGKALAQTAGTMMMRLADAEVLPFKFTNFAETVHTYIAEIKELDGNQRAHAKELNSEIDDGVYQAIADPKVRMVPTIGVRNPVRNTSPAMIAKNPRTEKVDIDPLDPARMQIP